MKTILLFASFLAIWGYSAQAFADDQALAPRCSLAGDEQASDFAKIYHTPASYPAEILQSGTSEQIADALENFCYVDMNSHSCLAQAPWIIMNSSRAEVDQAGLLIQERLANRYLQVTKFSQNTYEQVLEQAALAPAQYSPATVASVAAVMTAARANQSNGISQQLPKDESFIDAACAVFLDPTCPSALRELVQLAQVGTIASTIDGSGGKTDVTAMDAIQDLFSNPKYLRGTAIAAEILFKRVADAQNGILPNVHFFDDMKAAYLKSGLNEQQAQDFTFTFMAFYGARGASVEFVSDLTTSDNFPLLVASYIIGGALGTLDSYTLKTGHPYSLPATISTDCLYGRPYHFWLPAYYAYKLVKDGHSQTSSIIATHISEIGYEATANTVTRIPYSPITLSVKDPSNDSIHLNIVMGDAGAKFGAELGEGHHPSRMELDSRIETLFNSPSWVQPVQMTKAQDLFDNHLAEYLVIWDLTFHPNSGLIQILF